MRDVEPKADRDGQIEGWKCDQGRACLVDVDLV